MSVSRSNKTQSDFITRTQNGNTLLSIQSPLHGLVFCEIALLLRQFWDRCSFLHWVFATLRLREKPGQDGCQSAFWDCFVGRICRHVDMRPINSPTMHFGNHLDPVSCTTSKWRIVKLRGKVSEKFVHQYSPTVQFDTTLNGQYVPSKAESNILGVRVIESRPLLQFATSGSE